MIERTNLTKLQEKKLLSRIQSVCVARLQWLKDKEEYEYYEMAEICGLQPVRMSEIINFKTFSPKYLIALIRGGLMSTAILFSNLQNLNEDEVEYINKFSIYEDTELLALLERISNHKNKNRILGKIKKYIVKEIETEND